MTLSTISDYLTHDHARLDALLRLAQRPPEFDLDAFAQLRSGLLRHIAIEEKLLFPAARPRLSDAALDCVLELRIEHAALTSLLVPTPDLALCVELEWLLTRHNQKEEGAFGVYADCERALTADQSAELAARAAAFPQVRVARHFDSPRAYRTAEGALAAASRTRTSRA